MAKSGWCLEGRHIGTTPVYSKVCPDEYCDCPCHPDYKLRQTLTRPVSGDNTNTKRKK